MRPAAVAFVLAGLALLGWSERAADPGDALRGATASAVGGEAAREDALLRRGVELALAGGRAPTEERLFDGGSSLAAGRAPLVPALLAALARRSVLQDADALELARLEPSRLARLFVHLGPALGVAALLAVFAVVRLLHGGAARDVAGLLAAGLYALAPLVVLAERSGRVEPAALATLLGCALLAAARLAWGARAELDRTTGALLSGPLIGLALVAAPSLAPLCIASLAGSASGDSPTRNRARAFGLAALGALLVVNLLVGSPLRLLENWPAARLAAPAGGVEFALGWTAWVLLPVALAALVLSPRAAERRHLIAWCVLALVWAVVFGSRAPGVQLAACVSFAVAAADRHQDAAPRARPLVLAAALLLAAACGLGRRGPAFAPDARELARRADWAQALEVLRTSTPSSGPWNHAGARPDAFVLCAPEVAVEVAVGARRAVFACELPRLRVPPLRRERADLARALLDAPPTLESADELARLAVRYVLVGPGDPPRAPDGLARRLAECGPDEAPQGFERVWSSDAREDARSACALWAVR